MPASPHSPPLPLPSPAPWRVLAPLSPEQPPRTFLVDYRGRRCVLRLPHAEGLPLDTYAALRDWLAAGGLPVQAPVLAGPGHLLLEHVAGEPAGPWVGADVPPARVAAAFALLARLHALPAPPPALARRLPRDTWRPYLAAQREPWGPLRARLAAAGAALDEAPRVVCHGDFHPANLLFRDAVPVALLDYEYAQLSLAEYDLAYALLTFCGDWPRGGLRAAALATALAAYAAERGFSAARLEPMLPVAALALREWCAALPAGDPRRPRLLEHVDGLLAADLWPAVGAELRT
ncbi:MAG: phosphotransferase [Candidatus Lambdaproteobacteria bacterium]|nr:phosphotransferase [Candidatus Lambdaproteobacteria bacterium]